jgi:hypothetical protein
MTPNGAAPVESDREEGDCLELAAEESGAPLTEAAPLRSLEFPVPSVGSLLDAAMIPLGATD